MIAAMVCFQMGAALAKGLFPVAGASGTAALRLAFAALLLLAIWRPWHIRPSAQEARTLIIYGLAIGCMNFLFYSSLQTIPLGIAVALEFTGPLVLAIAASRRTIDFVWILMAALGLIALLPLAAESKPLSSVGIGFALGAGFCWALYIYFGRKAGSAHGGQTVAVGMLVGAIVIVPVGIAQEGMRLFTPSLLPAAFAVAVLSSALPYSLEMYAMPRLPTRTVGVLTSLNPAWGALCGWLFLGEKLTGMQWAAILSVMAASAGSAATNRSGY